MLGQVLHDPLGIEGPAGSTPGLGLLELATTLGGEREVRQLTGTLIENDIAVSGYAIHSGISEGAALNWPLFSLDGRPEGAVSADGQVMGTCLHGLFDSAAACQAILARCGLSAPGDALDYHTHRQRELDRLADTLEAHLDMAAIDRILGR